MLGSSSEQGNDPPPASSPRELILQTHPGLLLQFGGKEDGIKGQNVTPLVASLALAAAARGGYAVPDIPAAPRARSVTWGLHIMGRGLSNPALKTITKPKKKEPVPKQLSPVGMETIGRGKSNGWEALGKTSGVPETPGRTAESGGT